MSSRGFRGMHKLYCRFLYVRNVTGFSIRDRCWFDQCLYISPCILLGFELALGTYSGDTMKLFHLNHVNVSKFHIDIGKGLLGTP